MSTDFHSHGGDSHEPGAPAHGRAFALGVALNLGFVILEAAYGLKADSLALLADAGHNLSDGVSLLIAWGAYWLARRPPTRMRTYGFRRSSIYASLINAMLLLIAVGAIALEAVHRFQNPAPVAGTTVMMVAAAGIAVNTATALLFVSGRKHDLNLKSAFQHMAADAAVSLSVLLAALGIAVTGWLWLDPAVSLLIAAVITAGSIGLLRESADLALDAVPPAIDPSAVEAYFLQLPGIAEVHDLHIWAMSTTETALTVHLIRPGFAVDDRFLSEISQALHDRFDIDHPTIQIECGDAERACPLAARDVV
jgi:cobalt-zinc-cadmium efflux system protein